MRLSAETSPHGVDNSAKRTLRRIEACEAGARVPARNARVLCVSVCVCVCVSPPQGLSPVKPALFLIGNVTLKPSEALVICGSIDK